MKLVTQPSTLAILWETRESSFEDMMKIVVDVEREILAIDGELHADLEDLLLQSGSKQEHLWGANIYPSKGKESPDFIEFTAVINIRPSLGNKGMEIADPWIRKRISDIVHRLLV